MDIKTYLNQIFEAEKKIRFKSNRLIELKENATDVSAKPLGGDYVKSDKVNNKLGVTIEKYIDLEKEIDLLIKFKDCTEREIYEHISSLESIDEQMVLNYRYLNMMQFKEISNAMCYSLSHIYRLHRQAIDNLVI